MWLACKECLVIAWGLESPTLTGSVSMFALVFGFIRLCTVAPLLDKHVFYALLSQCPMRVLCTLSVLVLLSLEPGFLVLETDD